MSITNSSGWGQRDEFLTESPGAASDGSGGGLMSVWEATRSEKLNALGTSPGENKSSFGIPNAVVGNGSWAINHTDDEFLAGINARGTFVDSTSKPLSGTATVSTSGGQQVGSKSTTGSFVLNLGVPLGVDSGSDVPGEQYDFRWSPNISGINFSQDNIPVVYSAGVVKYGLLKGTITDFNGDPAPNIAVIGPGSAAVTDENGDYNLIGPGGTTETVETLRQTASKSITFNNNSVTVRDFQFPQLTIRVLDAEYRPVSGAPVDIDDVTYYTDDGGKVQIPDAGVKEHDVTVMGEFSNTFDVSSSGQEFVFTLGPPDSFGDFPDTQGLGGIEIEVTDAKTGVPVVNVAAEELTSGTKADANNGGIIRLLVTETGSEVEVQIARDHNRYRQKTITATIPEGTMLDRSIRLERVKTIGNRQG
jgi:hypothetical protein